MKRRTKRISTLALSAIIASLPLLNTSYAMNPINEQDLSKDASYTYNNNDNMYVNESLLLGSSNNTKEISDYSSYYESIENDFKNKFGNENEFKLIASSDTFKTEGNGYTGELRITTYNDDMTEDVIFIEYLNNVKNYLDQLEEDEKESSTYAESYVVSTVKSGGPDPLSFSVRTGGNYNSKYKMYATSWYGSNQTWYKNSDWNTGYTKGLYNELRYARNNVNNIASTLSPGVSKVEVLAALAGFLGATTPIPGINAIAAALAAFSFSVPVIKVAGYSLDYIKNINVAQYNYNNI